MGGFTVDVSDLHNTLSRLTVFAKRLAFLAKHGHFVKISDPAIRDKSKADMLAKSLICIQMGWMLVQTVFRKLVGYPVTLLEVHTSVHVACAIVMYGLWFQKPLFILSRIYIITETFIGLRHVQLGIYQTVQWTYSIPHL